MNYELVYILTPKLSEEEVKSKAKVISELLRKEETKVIKEDFWGKKELAYPIKHFDEGWYVLCEFSAEPGEVEKIDKALKLQEDIIRFLIVKKEAKKAVKEEKISKKPKEIKKIEKEVKKIEKPKLISREKKVKLEGLDKELEKILGEETEI